MSYKRLVFIKGESQLLWGEKSHRKTSSEPNTACAGSLPPPFRDQPAEVIQLAEDSSEVRKLRSD
jgi:hypothetical protein